MARKRVMVVAESQNSVDAKTSSQAPASEAPGGREHLDRLWGGGTEAKEQESENPTPDVVSQVFDHKVEAAEKQVKAGLVGKDGKEMVEAGKATSAVAGAFEAASGLATITDPEAKTSERVKAGIGLAGQGAGLLGGVGAEVVAPVVGGSLAATAVTKAGDQALTERGVFGKDGEGKNRDAAGASSDAGMAAKHATDSALGAIRIGKGGLMVDDHETAAGAMVGGATTVGAGMLTGSMALGAGVEQVGETLGKHVSPEDLAKQGAVAQQQESEAAAAWRANLAKASPEQKRAMIMEAIASGHVNRLTS
jgi:hypothetical protein